MERKTKEVVLPSGIIAVLHETISYGEHLAINRVIMEKSKLKGDNVNSEIDGTVALDWQRKKIQTVVKGFKENEKEIKYSDEFLNSLSMQDGEKLEEEVNAVLDSQKKR